MELERKMKRKLLAGVGIFILLALAGTWYADEAEKSPLVLQAKQESAEKQTGATEVIGLQQAIAGGEVRNPFSFVHEREWEPIQGAMRFPFAALWKAMASGWRCCVWAAIR